VLEASLASGEYQARNPPEFSGFQQEYNRIHSLHTSLGAHSSLKHFLLLNFAWLLAPFLLLTSPGAHRNFSWKLFPP
jgi:hypothetical protein